MRKFVVAIDFDETIAIRDEKLNPIGLMPHAKEVINWMYESFHVFVWTCREGYVLDLAEKFLKENDVRYHEMNLNSTSAIISRKVHADVYIDDKGLWTKNPIDWLEVKILIQQRFEEFQSKHAEIKETEDLLQEMEKK